jgi:hypothetical protein
MNNLPAKPERHALPQVRVERGDQLPAVVEAAGGNARFAYEEFLAGIDSPHTARAYKHALNRFLGHVDSSLGLELHQITPKVVSAYLRHFFDKPVERHAIMLNPALSVRGPKLSVREGKTKGLGVKQARQLLASIDVTTPVGLRDRAVIATLIYTAARRGAVAKLRRQDFHTDGRQHYFQLDEKGGKQRTIPCREDLERFMEAYMAAVGPMEGRIPQAVLPNHQHPLQSATTQRSPSGAVNGYFAPQPLVSATPTTIRIVPRTLQICFPRVFSKPNSSLIAAARWVTYSSHGLPQLRLTATLFSRVCACFLSIRRLRSLLHPDYLLRAPTRMVALL